VPLRLHREYASILDGLLRCVCQNAPHETVGDLLNRSNTSLTALDLSNDSGRSGTRASGERGVRRASTCLIDPCPAAPTGKIELSTLFVA